MSRTKVGIPYHTNDLGITFATWGVPDGPYLMLPVLGPSNPRDLAGDVGDSFGDPGNIVASQHHKVYASLARGVTSGIDERSRNIESLAEIERTSLDYYATIRSLERQRRAAAESGIRRKTCRTPARCKVRGAIPGPTAAVAAAPPRPATPPITYRMARRHSRVRSPMMQNSPIAPAGR